MRIDKYIPALPTSYTGSRGSYSYVTPLVIQHTFAHQGGGISPTCLSSKYILPDPDWMHTALLEFHTWQLAVTGKQPQYLYQKGVYVCTEFAWNFKAFLNLCHVLHWQKEIGNAKMAIGFAWTGNRPSGKIPAHHAITVTLYKEKGEYYLCGYEPQLAMSPQSRYVIEDCRHIIGLML